MTFDSTARDDTGVRTLSATESRLHAIWAQTLELAAERIGPEDNFIDLGGDSISGTLCLNLIRGAFDVEIRLETLLIDAIPLRSLACDIDARMAAR